ncbi:MAG: hypothetical protein L3V56_14045 [Candidatus Magnetoovum sp. WYHC-5]|nr:hypothetical protein [Candidatus Magnetoovum sp. WYHC-5]
MKVAFATTNGRDVDEHFGRADMFGVYEMTQEGYQFVEIRHVADVMEKPLDESKEELEAHDSKAIRRVESLADCKIVYLTEIGGPMAARLAKYGIMPIKVKEVVSIEESLEKLYETVKLSPPIWLKRALQQNG